MTLKHGTRIEVGGFDMQFARTWEAATICRPRKANLPIPAEGYHLVKFARDGAKLYVHEESFRVTDNRI